MNAKTWVVLGASLGVLGVAAGTFGAHGLPDYLELAGASGALPERLAWWETGVRYHMYHALALLGVAWVADRRRTMLPGLAGTSMFLGTLVFSGCLYALALTGVRVIGAIVPIGGVLMIVGWIMLAIAGSGLVEEPKFEKLSAREKLQSETKPGADEAEVEVPAETES